jgi:cyclopropane fatty-acyl-phospholipid synthase-like methyltransferase
MLLSRTRKRINYGLKLRIFEIGNFQRMLDQRDKMRIEDSMGFRGQFDEHRRFQIAMLKERGLLPSHHLLEIGCGPLTGGIPIIQYLQSNNYVGIDVRRSVLDISWQEVGKAGLSEKNPRLICSSEFGSTELADRKFDVVFSFSVLFHLSEEILASYFATVRERLKLNGQCLANVNTKNDSNAWLEFPFLKRTIEDYRKLASVHGLETTDLGEIKDLGFRLPTEERHNQLLSFRPTGLIP